MEGRGRERGQPSIVNLGRDRVGQRGQVQKGCGDKRRQVTEAVTRAGTAWPGSTAGREAGLGRLLLGQVPARLLVPWRCRVGQGRVAGRPEGGMLGLLPIWLGGSPLTDSSRLFSVA